MIQTNKNFREIFIVAIGSDTSGGHSDEGVLKPSGVEEDKRPSRVAVTFLVAATIVAGTKRVRHKLVRKVIPDDALGGIAIVGQGAVAVTKKKDGQKTA
jgi:hypothetical protein